MHRHLAGSLRAARLLSLAVIVALATATALAGAAAAQASKHGPHAHAKADRHNKKKRRRAHASRDTTPPTAPANLAARPGNQQVTVTWKASNDNTHVRAYRIYANGSLAGIASGKTTVYTVAPVTNGMPYTFTARAYDPAGNLSAPSNAVTVTPGGSAGTTPPSTPGAPNGPTGTWTLKFDDEFNGTSLDTTKWTDTWFNGGSMNKVATAASNVAVGGGAATLQLSDSSHGALIHTQGASGGYTLPVGGVVEAHIWFPGNGTSLYNWPAFWANSTGNWPAGGEHDIAEVLGGQLTVNYHSPSGTHNQGAPSGYWGDAWHTYTLHRKSGSADVYWDGKLVKSYSTDDNGSREDIVLNVGAGSPTMTGPAGAIKVDYVRAWE
ncbi:MAG TPA: hypothetical protein VE570_14120 [Thermoleophilaceae bacterium]|jgi:hypothetical protein|nr:hypothetical protein [Thermoleophilaceae bacterium]